MVEFWVNGIVRDQLPYIQLASEKGMIAQLSVGQARRVAVDILATCSRAETEAMIHRFMRERVENEDAANRLMMALREYRAELDRDVVEGRMMDSGEEV